MNVELLNKICEAILKEPEKFDMAEWFFNHNTVLVLSLDDCGTTACIAGWAWTMENKSRTLAAPAVGIAVSAAQYLQLTYEQAKRLFYRIHWPKDFQRRYNEQWYAINGIDGTVRDITALQRKEAMLNAAKIAVERIQHFIKTEGRE